MFLSTNNLALGALFINTLIFSTFGDDTTGKCQKQPGICDQFSPCCNNHGWCGKTYAFCGDGCYEPGNFKGTKCLPKPACKAETIKFDKSRIISSSDYKGNFKNFDFTIDGDWEVRDGEVIVKMSKKGSGATLHSTRYINYGKITAQIKTARGSGVVSSFITMSDTKDEIDFEWVGHELNSVQSNWFHRGKIPEWPATNGGKHNQTDSFSDWHEYTIDWSKDTIKWLVDGKQVREQKKEGDEFPSTPSRYSFGLWDGGSGAEGTRDWAGGYIDWESEDMKKLGYYSVNVKSVKIECYGEPTSKDDEFNFDIKDGASLKDNSKSKNKAQTDKDKDSDFTPLDDKEPGSQPSPQSNGVETRRPVKSSAYISSSSLTFLPLIAGLYFVN